MEGGDRSTMGESGEALAELRGQFAELLRGSDRRGARRMLRRAVAAGVDRQLLMREVVSPAVEEVGGAWSEHEVSLSQVYAAGLIVEDGVEILSIPTGPAEGPPRRVVIGTARGDYHGLGRRLVTAFLRAAGFVVVDLGLNVSPGTFVDATLEEGARIIAVSALMVDAALGIREVREEMVRREVRGVKLLVGGAPFRFNSDLCRLVGADATAPDAFRAIQVAESLLDGGG